MIHYPRAAACIFTDLTCKRGSVGQSEGLSIPRSSVRFRLKPDNSNSHGFELHRPSNKGTKLLLKVIKAIIITRLRAEESSDFIEAHRGVPSCEKPYEIVIYLHVCVFDL